MCDSGHDTTGHITCSHNSIQRQELQLTQILGSNTLPLALLLQLLSQVLRGYVGDREAKPVFQGSTPFDILGTGYQRPFELATLRLFNMVGILPKCKSVEAWSVEAWIAM
jgi:hypothetical protein